MMQQSWGKKMDNTLSICDMEEDLTNCIVSIENIQPHVLADNEIFLVTSSGFLEFEAEVGSHEDGDKLSQVLSAADTLAETDSTTLGLAELCH